MPAATRLILFLSMASHLLVSGNASPAIASQDHRRFGHASCFCGDLDGDGVHDILIGSPRDDGRRGRVYGFSGKSGKRLFALDGPDNEPWFGTAVEGIGDWDDDGISDFAIGLIDIWADNHRAGRVLIYSGKSRKLLRTLAAPEGMLSFGMRIMALPDCDGDGVGDLSISAIEGDPTNARTVFCVISGRTARLHSKYVGPLRGSGAWRDEARMVNLGDINNDGAFDVALCFESAAHGAGEVHIVDLPRNRLLRTIVGGEGEQIGEGIVALGDVDGDDCDDYVISVAPRRHEDFKTVVWGARAYSGEQGEEIYKCDEVTWRKDAHGRKGDGACLTMAFLADINGDEVGDWLTLVSDAFSWSLYFVSGRDGRLLSSTNLQRHTKGMIPGPSGLPPDDLTTGHDLNGDHLPEVMVRTYSSDSLGWNNQGVLIVSSKSDKPLYAITLRTEF